MTGLSFFRTSTSKVWSVTTLVAPTCDHTPLTCDELLLHVSCRADAHDQVSWLASQRSASSAAAQPVPAAVTACRYVRSTTSPAAKTPSMAVRVDGWSTSR